MSRYLGQCDVVRRRGPAEETSWQRMMEFAEPISTETFLRHVDISTLLDDGETARQFVRDSKAKAFRSIWDTERCWFLAIAGFEFIFVEG
jgi:hypothetical protein